MSTNESENFENILKKLKSLVGASNDKELALKMGYSSTGTISYWRKRGSIDYDKVSQCFPEISIADLIAPDNSNNLNLLGEPPIPYAAQVELPASGELSQAELKQLIEQIELLLKIVKGNLK